MTAAFGSFREEVNPANGLVAENSRGNSPSSIAIVGFALEAVADERHFGHAIGRRETRVGGER